MNGGRRRLLIATLAIIGARAACAKEAPDLPLAVDLRADAAEAKRRKVPILLLYSLAGCPYCDQVRRSFLLPMMANVATSKRALFRQVNLSDAKPLLDFAGKATSHAAFSHEAGVTLAPVVAFFDRQGHQAAEPLKGMLLPDFYGYYLDTALETATRRVSATSQ